jgi:trk system potassium uptake protein
MNILLTNGNQKAGFLAEILQAKGHSLTVIDPDPERCRMFAGTYGVMTVCGDGTQARTLQNARAGQMDAVIAMDERDPVNLIVCELAKKRFRVRYAYAVVNDPQNIELFKKLGVDKYVNATRLLADFVEQDSLENNIKKYLPIENGKVVLCEIVLDERSPALNQKLWEIGFPPQSIVSCLIRGEETIIPQGNTELAAGDKIILISSSNVMNEALYLLDGIRR